MFFVKLLFFPWTAKNPAPSKVGNTRSTAGGPTRIGAGAQRGGAQGVSRPGQQAARPAGGAGGASAALMQKDTQIQELNNEVC